MREGDVQNAPVVYVSPREYDLVERLTLYHPTVAETDEFRVDLELVLRPSSGKTGTRLTLHFGGVRDLQFLQTWGPQIYPLEVRSMEHWQWEGLAYRVIDIEEESLAFWCATFEASSVGDLPTRHG